MLVPGTTVALPVTVRNTGGSVSEPVTVTLMLPEGVRAVRGGGGGSSPLGRTAAPAARPGDSPTSTVYCPPSTGGTVTCGTDRGLSPGESVKLLFHLRATDKAEPGRITGALDSGATEPINISIPVTVPEEDDIRLTVSTAWPWHSLRITVVNTGSSTGRITVTIDGDAHVWDAAEFTCTDGPAQGVSCTTTGKVPPKDAVDLRVTPTDWRQPCSQRVRVTAGLGEASATSTVTLEWPGLPCQWPFTHPRPGEPPHPVPPVDLEPVRPPNDEE